MSDANKNAMQHKVLQMDLNSSAASVNPTNKSVHATTPDGMSYRQQVAALNCLSYSTQSTLHSCPRRFLLEKLTAADSSDSTDNIDFLFGHAVGAGIQNYLLTKDVDRAIWDALLSWRGDLAIEHPKKGKNKSFAYAVIAIMKFADAMHDLLQDWELAMIDSKPAIELAFSLDIENGYIYLGHIDAILWSPSQQKFMVLELKTTTFNSVHEAQYKNSPQALGYSIVVDAIAERMGIDASNYDVLYLVYKAGVMEYDVLPFFKTKSQRAAWLLQLQMDSTIVDFYRQTEHFPTHGESCYSFFRPCEFFGTCDMLQYVNSLMKNARIAEAGEKVAGVDFYFKASELAEITVS